MSTRYSTTPVIFRIFILPLTKALIPFTGIHLLFVLQCITNTMINYFFGLNQCLTAKTVGLGHKKISLRARTSQKTLYAV